MGLNSTYLKPEIIKTNEITHLRLQSRPISFGQVARLYYPFFRSPKVCFRLITFKKCHIAARVHYSELVKHPQEAVLKRETEGCHQRSSLHEYGS